MSWTFPTTRVEAGGLDVLDAVGVPQKGYGAAASAHAIGQLVAAAKALITSGALGDGPWFVSGGGHSNPDAGKPTDGWANDMLSVHVSAITEAEPAGEVVLDADEDAVAAGHVVGEAPPEDYVPENAPES